jgi:hypothetical protein
LPESFLLQPAPRRSLPKAPVAAILAVEETCNSPFFSVKINIRAVLEPPLMLPVGAFPFLRFIIKLDLTWFLKSVLFSTSVYSISLGDKARLSEARP